MHEQPEVGESYEDREPPGPESVRPTTGEQCESCCNEQKNRAQGWESLPNQARTAAHDPCDSDDWYNLAWSQRS
ncbi:hypothetical protein GCM10017690_08420 [Microbacterium terregens]